MVYRTLADAVMIVHLAFILFVATGALLTWRWPGVAWAHLPALVWGLGTVTIGFPCPLTSLEKAFERRGGGSSYDGGFIDQYVEDVVFPGEYSSMLRAAAALLVVVGYIGLRRRRQRRTCTYAPGVVFERGHASRIHGPATMIGSSG